jgi:hypothetical protein
MNYMNLHRPALGPLLVVLMITFVVSVQAQYGPGTKSQGSSKKGSPSLTATLVDPEKKAQQKLRLFR